MKYIYVDELGVFCIEGAFPFFFVHRLYKGLECKFGGGRGGYKQLSDESISAVKVDGLD